MTQITKWMEWQKGKLTVPPGPECSDFLVTYETAVTTSLGF